MRRTPTSTGRPAPGWAGGAEELGLKGPVDPDTFRAVLEGRVPDGSGRQLGRRGRDGEILHRPGRDLTFSAPKSVSLAALVGGDDRITEAHDRAVAATLAWVERHAAETRMKDGQTGQIGRTGNQKIVAATFRHDTSRNLDPQLHTHAVLANMVQGEDGKWRSMANEGLYEKQKLIGMLYRNELAGGLARLGYGIEKSHADGRFEIAGVPREAIAAFSTRRAEIEAAMAARGLGASADNPRLAERAALMTRAAKRDIDREELRGLWRQQAVDLGFDAKGLVAEAAEIPASPQRQATPGATGAAASANTPDRNAQPELPAQAPGPDGPAEPAPPSPAAVAVDWALAHLSERQAVFSRTDLLTAILSRAPGAVMIDEAEREVAALEEAGDAACRRHPRGGGLAHHRAHGRRGARDHGAVARRRGPKPGGHARLAGAGSPQPGAADGRAEGGGAAHPVGDGPHGWACKAMPAPARPPCSTGSGRSRRRRAGA